MSNSKMDTWPLQVRSMVERKARAMEPGSTGWQVHRRGSNSAQGSTHLVGRGMVQVRPLGVQDGRNSRKEAARSGEEGLGARTLGSGGREGLGPWARADEAPAADGPRRQLLTYRAPQCFLQKAWAGALVSWYVCPQYFPPGKSALSSVSMWLKIRASLASCRL